MSGDYQLVQLPNGAQTLVSASYGEKMHPGLGPQAEAELLYVRQLKICERLRNHTGEFVIWDIGLGAAANAIAALRATREIAGELRLASFDNTAEPLEFALKNAGALGYVAGYEEALAALLHDRHAEFQNGKLQVRWEFHLGDFPAWLGGSRREEAQSKHKSEPANEQEGRARHSVRAGVSLAINDGAHGVTRPTRAGFARVHETHAAPSGSSDSPRVGGYEIPPPHAIFFDAFSPAKNPAMWTLPVFEKLFRALDPARSCALTTYSRSTLIRATLLLAGFFVGVGHATGMKEETTIAANTLDLLAEPLGARWLERAARSDSAEPLREPVYSRSPLAATTRQQLYSHPQFNQIFSNIR